MWPVGLIMMMVPGGWLGPVETWWVQRPSCLRRPSAGPLRCRSGFRSGPSNVPSQLVEILAAAGRNVPDIGGGVDRGGDLGAMPTVPIGPWGAVVTEVWVAGGFPVGRVLPHPSHRPEPR